MIQASNSTIFLRGLVQIIGTLVIIGISTPYTLVTFVPLIAMFFWTYRYVALCPSLTKIPQYIFFDVAKNSIVGYIFDGDVVALCPSVGFLFTGCSDLVPLLCIVF